MDALINSQSTLSLYFVFVVGRSVAQTFLRVKVFNELIEISHSCPIIDLENLGGQSFGPANDWGSSKWTP